MAWGVGVGFGFLLGWGVGFWSGDLRFWGVWVVQVGSGNGLGGFGESGGFGIGS